jgi:hypothetical protein
MHSYLQSIDFNLHPFLDIFILLPPISYKQFTISHHPIKAGYPLLHHIPLKSVIVEDPSGLQERYPRETVC